MNEKDPALKKSNIRLAIALASFSMLLSLWPLYIMQKALGS